MKLEKDKSRNVASRFSFMDTDNSQDSRGREHLSFHSTTSTCSQTFRHYQLIKVPFD